MLRLIALSVVIVIAGLSAVASRADIPPPGDPYYDPHGIGADLIQGDPFPVLTNVAPDGPAARAGIRDGDGVIAIDGTYTKDGSTLDELRRLLVGNRQIPVQLVLLFSGGDRPSVRVVTVRRTVPLPKH